MQILPVLPKDFYGTAQNKFYFFYKWNPKQQRYAFCSDCVNVKFDLKNVVPMLYPTKNPEDKSPGFPLFTGSENES